MLRDVRGNHEKALRSFREAGEIHRRLGMGRPEAMMAAEQALCLVNLRRKDEALPLIEDLQRRVEDGGAFPQLDAILRRATAALHGNDGEDGGRRPDGLKVHERLEEILATSAGAWERLHEILSLLCEALEIDGAFLARVHGGQLEILSSMGIETLRGSRNVAAGQLGIDPAALSEPKLSVEIDPKAPGLKGSRLVIPIELRGVAHVLFLRRDPAKGRSLMSRAESNYAMVLAAEIARALEIGSPHQDFAEVAGGIALADVITQDPQMLRILDLIRRVGDTGLSVLLQGETGTGKKLLAHAIHRASGRRNRAIVTVDCAALPETLLEAELFGYRKGAFTGAQQDRTGLLAEAAGGTVFLDEIDKAGLGVQRRFLHLLDSGEIRPVGSTSYVRLDVRIVCATSSPDLRVEVADGRFLKDLYYRLNDISIQIPPLRERREDILLLAGCFVETIAAQAGRRIRGMSSSFRRRLLEHDWPGNVRELEKAIRRAITLADDDVLLTPDLLPREIIEGLEDSKEQSDDQLKNQVETFERRAIERALESCDGNKSRAASLLGLSRKGLKGKIARYRIGTQASS
jgi:DNA-binding NtrC family response regulator